METLRNVKQEKQGTEEAVPAFDVRRLTPGHLRTLRLVAEAAAARSSVKLSKWLRRLTGLTVSRIDLVQLPDAPKLIGGGSELITACLLELEVGIEGSLMMGLTDSSAKRIVSSLVRGEPKNPDEWGELEQSAIMETSNIIGTAFTNVLSDILDLKVLTTSPMYARDLGGALMEEILTDQARASDFAIVMQAEFFEGDYHEGSLDAMHLIFLPSPKSLTDLMNRLGLQ